MRTARGKGFDSEGIVPLLRPHGSSDLPRVVEFAESREYLDLPRLYPGQRALLELVYAPSQPMSERAERIVDGWTETFYGGEIREGVVPDVRQRIAWLKQHERPHPSHVVLIAGRRAGKGHLASICMLYEMFRLIQLQDPQAAYGMAPGKKIKALCIARTFPQSKSTVFTDVKGMILSAPCFRGRVVDVNSSRIRLMTSADEARLQQSGMPRDDAARRTFASLEIEAVPAHSSALRGSAVIMAVFDEFAHVQETEGPDTGSTLYQAVAPSLHQFAGDGSIWVTTSPSTTEGQAYALYEAGLEMSDDE